jgi:hypothetical protein
MKNETNITIYQTAGFMGVQKYEGKLVDFGTKKYAQYDNAPFISYIPKGKRKAIGFIKTYQPYIVVIEGHNHLDTLDAFKAPVITPGLIVKQSKYLSFDERYKTDFDGLLTEYIKDKKIIMDVRHTVNTNLINK